MVTPEAPCARDAQTLTSGDGQVRTFLLGIILVAAATTAFGQPAGPPYLNPALSPAERAADLVSRMTLEEKVLQMQNSTPAIPRLGVPVYNWWNEALHGVAQRRATVFPEPIGLGATFDPGLVRKMADVISTEARAKFHEAMRQPPVTEVAPGAAPGRIAYLDYWSPNINIFRDPRWGRGQETYGEDPFLTSRMGVAFVKGMQGDDPRYLKTIATPKHFAVHSGPEPLRHSFDAKVSEYDLVNTYLYAFKATVTEGKAGSIMCVYNAVDGVPGCASTDLLQKRLRDQWGFKGYVVSDCGAIGDIFRSHKYSATQGAASVAAVKAGTDLTCGGEYKSLLDEVKAGTITEAEITRAAERLFEARIRLGMFDPPERVPYTKIPYSVNDSAPHRQLARQAEREAIVLLKNQGGILPLKPTVGRIAVIGPSAADPVGLLGNYNGISSKQVTPLEGIVEQFAKAKVQYALGANYTSTTPALVAPNVLTTPDGIGPGLLAEYWDNPDFQGQPKLRRTEPRVYFDSFMEEPAVMTAINGEKYAIRWTGSLTPPATGDYVLSARTGQWNRNGRIRLFLDDKDVSPSGPAGARPAGLGPGQGQGQDPGPGGRRLPAPVALEGGRKYSVRVEFQQMGPEGSAEFNWIPPAPVLLAEAEKVAKDSDVVIVCVGLNGSLEGEGRDRTAIELPETEENLVKSMIATGKPVVVVLTSGSALAVNYAAEHADAILSAWYGGEEAGSAIADTLAGTNNPAGRLPVTFYRSTSQLPAFTDYNMKGHTYRYFKGEPLYPFGFGLSYSTFQYSGLTAKRTPKGAEIRATVKNMSALDGDEVVQVYVDGGPGDDAPIRNLRGFQRIHLRAGESRQVTFTIPSGDLPEEKTAISVGGGQPLAGIPHLKTEL
jgi:beta-glucosidase